MSIVCPIAGRVLIVCEEKSLLLIEVGRRLVLIDTRQPFQSLWDVDNQHSVVFQCHFGDSFWGCVEHKLYSLRAKDGVFHLVAEFPCSFADATIFTNASHMVLTQYHRPRLSHATIPYAGDIEFRELTLVEPPIGSTSHHLQTRLEHLDPFEPHQRLPSLPRHLHQGSMVFHFGVEWVAHAGSVWNTRTHMLTVLPNITELLHTGVYEEPHHHWLLGANKEELRLLVVSFEGGVVQVVLEIDVPSRKSELKKVLFRRQECFLVTTKQVWSRQGDHMTLLFDSFDSFAASDTKLFVVENSYLYNC